MPDSPAALILPQTKHQIRALLEAEGLRANRRYGQHFLIDGNLMRKLALSGGIRPGDLVLEIGGGTGGLTDLLAEQADTLLVFEIDAGLHRILVRRYADRPHVRIIHADALEGKHALHPEIRSAGAADRPIRLIANLPYQIATPFILNLLLDAPSLLCMCITIQREVADRLVARPGSREYGSAAILMQTYCQISPIAQVPPEAFWPRPKVESSMIRIEPLPASVDPFVAGASQAGNEAAGEQTNLGHGGRLGRRAFARLLRGAFDYRRKNLGKALRLSGVTPEDLARLPSTWLEQRPEQIEAATWAEVARRLFRV